MVHIPAKKLDLTVEFNFSAAHRLPRYQGPCFDLHGHNYVLFVTIDGVPDAASGLIIDFDDIEKIVQARVLSRCDHKFLNDFIENPTAEVIIQWMWNELAPALEGLKELKLYETPRYAATLSRA